MTCTSRIPHIQESTGPVPHVSDIYWVYTACTSPVPQVPDINLHCMACTKLVSHVPNTHTHTLGGNGGWVWAVVDDREVWRVNGWVGEGGGWRVWNVKGEEAVLMGSLLNTVGYHGYVHYHGQLMSSKPVEKRLELWTYIHLVLLLLLLLIFLLLLAPSCFYL